MMPGSSSVSLLCSLSSSASSPASYPGQVNKLHDHLVSLFFRPFSMKETLPENVMDKVLDLCTMKDLITFSLTSSPYFHKVSCMGIWNEIMVNNGFPASLSSALAKAHVIYLHNENGLCERCQLYGRKPITPCTGSKGFSK
ncbi:hypothetical protein DM01DRAFT_1046547 [Hesseltinella vesiculosa]|uniref:F-box domain-containing protein n=1 Tax=Hesseltinella vesiculosa TaxID=101127 RepID=A0A1X2GGV6_9FUNG|nr:hypothetical protein DM01DRAFT_1046547 [Hesseltinella vesiculosa]